MTWSSPLKTANVIDYTNRTSNDFRDDVRVRGCNVQAKEGDGQTWRIQRVGPFFGNGNNDWHSFNWYDALGLSLGSRICGQSRFFRPQKMMSLYFRLEWDVHIPHLFNQNQHPVLTRPIPNPKKMAKLWSLGLSAEFEGHAEPESSIWVTAAYLAPVSRNGTGLAYPPVHLHHAHLEPPVNEFGDYGHLPMFQSHGGEGMRSMLC